VTRQQDPQEESNLGAHLEAVVASFKTPLPEGWEDALRATAKLSRQAIAARASADARVREGWAIVERYDLYPDEVAALGLPDPLETRGNKLKPDDRAVELIAQLVFREGWDRCEAYDEAAKRLKEATGSPTSLANIAKRLSRKFLAAEKRQVFSSY
jgi:hypothetical protein